MKKTISLILLIAMFLAGYYVGRLPGAPDVFAWARKVCIYAGAVGAKVGSQGGDTCKAKSCEPDKSVARAGGTGQLPLGPCP